MNSTIKTLSIAFFGGLIAISGFKLMPQGEKISELKSSESSMILPVSLPSNNIKHTLDFTKAAESSLNSVVHITTKVKRKKLSEEEKLFEMFYGSRSSKAPQIGSGSGVIISKEGYIVTNNHVVENADVIKVILNDNREYDATIIGTDVSTDMAVIKIDESNLEVITIGNSDEIKVGEWVLAVGNPFNLTSTVTAGIVSAKGRSINIMKQSRSRNNQNNFFPIESFIQTDAAVNPGNSGGALVNTSGELIGINTAIASKTGSYSGYSFAVPVNIMKKVAADMIKYGVVQRAFIGVSIQEMSQELANQLKIENTEGVFVNGVSKTGAAKKAGINRGDVIIQIGEVEVKTVPQLQEQIGNYNPGDKIEVALLRDGKKQIKKLELTNLEGNTKLVSKSGIIKG